MKRFLRAAAWVSVSVAFLNVAAQAQEVGQATAIKSAAYQQAPQQSAVGLNVRDPINWKSALSTPTNGALEVKFQDDSKLSMGANSTIIVDEFTYSGPGSAGQQTLKMTKGLFRYISGNMPKDKVKIETPTVTIGIRGTILRILQNDAGSGEISVDFGPNGEVYEVVITSKLTGKTIVIKSGQKVKFDAEGVFDGIADGMVEGCGP